MDTLTVTTVLASVLPSVGVIAVLFILRQPPRVTEIERSMEAIIGVNKKMIEALREESETLRADVRELRHDAAFLRVLVNELTSQVLKLGGQPATLKDVEKVQTAALQEISNNTHAMLRILKRQFNIEELDQLAFSLNVPSGTLGSGTKEDRALRLIEWCKSRDKLLDLSFELQRERPTVTN